MNVEIVDAFGRRAVSFTTRWVAGAAERSLIVTPDLRSLASWRPLAADSCAIAAGFVTA